MRLNFIGLRREVDENTAEESIIEYELNLHENVISCLYKDKYGAYVCTKQGKVYKVKHSMNELQELCAL